MNHVGRLQVLDTFGEESQDEISSKKIEGEKLPKFCCTRETSGSMLAARILNLETTPPNLTWNIECQRKKGSA